MVLPVYLAMTGREMLYAQALPSHLGYLGCHFSPVGPGLSGLPGTLPKGSLLILDDRFPCQGHSPDLIAGQLTDLATEVDPPAVILDFQRPGEPEAEAVAKAVLKALPCPVAVSDPYAGDLDCQVFLAPGPLHQPPERWLAPWKGREIWLEAALCQEVITVTENGTTYAPRFPPENLTGGFYDDELCCCYRTEVQPDKVIFTLFDTPQSLQKKLEYARNLGVQQAVGLYQELKDTLFFRTK